MREKSITSNRLSNKKNNLLPFNKHSILLAGSNSKQLINFKQLGKILKFHRIDKLHLMMILNKVIKFVMLYQFNQN